MTEENQTPEAEGADFKIAPIANGVRLYVNANIDHGILQMVGVADPENTNLEDLPPHGEHVLCQIAYTAEQLLLLSGQLESLAQEIIRVQEEKAEADDPEESGGE